MDADIELFKTRLKQHGLSHTRPRRAVFLALQTSGHRPISPGELVAACNGQADRASVYRAIEKLASANIIQRVYQGWKYKLELGDDFHGHHHHVTCIGCGTVASVDEDRALDGLLESMTASTGYRVMGHHLEIRGLCPGCQEKNGTPG